jgi:hypothetical protein
LTTGDPLCDQDGVKPRKRLVTYIDGIAYPRGERGDLTAFCLWYGGKALLLLLVIGIFVKLVDWLVDHLFF